MQHEIDDSIEKLRGQIECCDSRDSLFHTVLVCLRHMHPHSSESTAPETSKVEAIVPSSIEDDMEFQELKSKVYDLETETNKLRMDLNDVNTLAADAVAVANDGVSKTALEDLQKRMENAENKSVCKDDLSYLQEMLAVTDGRVDFLRSQMEAVDLDSVKKQKLGVLLEPSATNEFLPKLTEMISTGLEGLRENLEKTNAQMVSNELQAMKTKVENRLVSVQTKITQLVEEGLRHKFESMEQSNM
jgi:hypothetical protein